MAAGLATLAELRAVERVRGDGSRRAAAYVTGGRPRPAAHGFAIRQTGPPQMPLVLFDGDADLTVGRAWASECVARGVFVHPWHNMFLSTAHSDGEIDEALARTDDAFAALRRRCPPG